MDRTRRRAVVVVLLLVAALGLSVHLAARALSDPLVRDPGRATATILSTGTGPGDQRWVGVRFVTPTHAVATRIAVSDHRPYDVGATIAVVYDRDHPVVVAERDTQGTLAEALVVPGLLLLGGAAGALRVARRARRMRRRRRPPAPPAWRHVREPAPVYRESAGQYLRSALADA